MTRQELFDQILEKKSFLCVGLDTDITKIPKHLLDSEDPIFEFNKQIIDATLPYAVAYKPNLAFYEAQGSKGISALEKTMAYIPNNIFTIADAKRGDIGNTSDQYAKAFFENMSFDSVTVAPYMGEDSVSPYFKYDGKWAIILAATSNNGSFDFQELLIESSSEKLYERVINVSSKWGSADNTMYVVGATRPESLIGVRTIIPDHFLLVPGVGAQGGSLEQVCKFGMNKQCGLLINSSRGIIYAGSGEDFADAAANAAQEIQLSMAEQLQLSFDE
ncbi:MAG: orotidine-5'-phosphate decarboxylase [Cyclobacteriaceae bacterium]